jgi:hypothetical protein
MTPKYTFNENDENWWVISSECPMKKDLKVLPGGFCFLGIKKNGKFIPTSRCVHTDKNKLKAPSNNIFELCDYPEEIEIEGEEPLSKAVEV